MLVSKSLVLRLAQRFRQEKWRGYALGLAVFVLALAVRFAMDGILPNGFPFLTFFPAIVLTTLLAGRGPGSACALVSLLSAWYWFITPRNSFYLDFEVAVAVIFLESSPSSISWSLT